MADPDPEEIREQIVDAFEGVEYPVANRMEFPPRLPDGPATMFEPGMRSFFVALVSLTIAMHGFNLATHLGEELEDPVTNIPESSH